MASERGLRIVGWTTDFHFPYKITACLRGWVVTHVHPYTTVTMISLMPAIQLDEQHPIRFPWELLMLDLVLDVHRITTDHLVGTGDQLMQRAGTRIASSSYRNMCTMHRTRCRYPAFVHDIVLVYWGSNSIDLILSLLSCCNKKTSESTI